MINLRDERFSFLELTQGQNAAVVGLVSNALIEQIEVYYQSVNIVNFSDFHETEQSIKPQPTIRHHHKFQIGNFTLPDSSFDLIAIFWCRHYLGDSSKWLPYCVSKLNPNGRLIVIDQNDRKKYQDQKISSDFLTLRLKSFALKGNNVFPSYNSKYLINSARSLPLKSLHLRSYSDKDLLIGSDEWHLEITEFIRDSKDSFRNDKRRMVTSFQEQINNLKEYLQSGEPSTPPFFVLSGIKKPSFIEKPVRSKFEVILPKTQPEMIDEAQPDSSLHSTHQSLSELCNCLITSRSADLSNLDLFRIALSDTFHNSDQVSKNLIDEYGKSTISFESDPNRVSSILGISLENACKIIAILHLGKRLFDNNSLIDTYIRTSDDAYKQFQNLENQRKEKLRGLYINLQSRLVRDEIISIGTLSRTIIDPREVFTPALEYGACSLYLAHNHPSGDPTPSDEDIKITKKLIKAGEVLGIELIDHLVIGSGTFLSMRKENLM